MQWYWYIIIIIFISMVVAGNSINDEKSRKDNKCPRCHGSGTGMEIYEPCYVCNGIGKYFNEEDRG